MTLTVVRLTDPQQAWLIRLESFTPMALVLYVALFVWMSGWTLRHRRWAWMLVFPLAGAAVHGWWLAPLYVGPNPPPSAAASPLVVMTGNLHFGQADGTALVSAATAAHVDLLVLEEVTAGELATMDRAGLSELLPHHAGAAARGGAGTMIFSRDPLGDPSPLPALSRSWRGTVHASDGPLLLFAVHPLPPTDPGGWTRDHRALAALAVAERAAQIATSWWGHRWLRSRPTPWRYREPTTERSSPPLPPSRVADVREPLIRTPEEVVDDDYWLAVYGEWDALDVVGVREFFEGFDRPWWLIGGWAVEAFTGEAREHEDIDVSILACDVPALRAHVGMRFQLWNICEGALRPLTDRWPGLMDPESQIWVRRDARSPWLIDLPVTPDVDGAWRNKRLPEHVAPIDEVTWLTDDGVRALDPEIVLLFKARLDRAKDRRDRDRALPLLTSQQRRWLRDGLRRLEPQHDWLNVL